jgi:putative heme-binding domain-containing protein
VIIIWRVRVCVIFVMISALSGQTKYARLDIEAGERLYNANCTYCHGPGGGEIPGIDLLHGKFRRAFSDNDLIEIIRNGIPNTGMPALQTTAGQAKTVVAYLRSGGMIQSSGQITAGDAKRGEAIFLGKGQCLTCHIVNDRGSGLGPDLSSVGLLRSVADLERSIVDPSAVILPQDRFFKAVRKDGSVVEGRILNQDTFTVQLLDSKERLLSLSRTDLTEFRAVDKSLMPSYKDKLSSAELADVITYLASLKGR